jgi:secreted trypsin-like serine protease
VVPNWVYWFNALISWGVKSGGIFVNQSKLLMAGILSSLVLAACAPKGETSQDLANGDSIIGGTEVAETDKILQSIVAVYDKTAKQLCTGSLLENNVVVTAAHCIGNGEMYVFFGTSLGPTVPRRIVDVFAISNYWAARNSEKFNTGDIALIHFQGTVPEGFKPAKMLRDKKILKNGLDVTLAGFGISNGVSGEGAGVLRQTSVKISDARYSASEVLLDQTHGTGSCHGDSGGPAYVEINGEYVLWGVTSRGVNDTNNDCSQSVAYTSTVYYSPWIQRMQVKFQEHFAKQIPVSAPTP